MISSTLKGYWIYRNDGVVLCCLIEKFVFKFGFEKKSHFYIKRSIEISRKGLRNIALNR